MYEIIFTVSSENMLLEIVLECISYLFYLLAFTIVSHYSTESSLSVILIVVNSLICFFSEGCRNLETSGYHGGS